MGEQVFSSEKNPSIGKSLMFYAFLLIAFNSLLYYGISSYGYVWDDWHFMYTYSWEDVVVSAQGSWKALNPLLPDYYRPMFIFFNYVDNKIWHGSQSGYHTTNLMLHIANSTLLFLILNKLFKSSQATKENAHILSFASSLLWCILPFASMSPTYTSDRGTLLAFTLGLLSFLFYIKSAETSVSINSVNTSNGSAKKTLYIILSCISLFLALLTKEQAATFVIMISVYHFLFFRQKNNITKQKTSQKNTYSELLAVWACFALYLIIRSAALKGLGLSSFTYGRTMLTDLIVKAGTFAANFIFMVLPFADIEVPLFFHIIALFVFLAVIWLSYAILKKFRFFSDQGKTIIFLLTWIFVNAAITYASLGSRLLYYAGAGYAALIVYLFYSFMASHNFLSAKTFSHTFAKYFAILLLIAFISVCAIGSFISQYDYSPTSKFALARDIHAYTQQYTNGLLRQNQDKLLIEKLEHYDILVNGQISQLNDIKDNRLTLRKELTLFAAEKFNLQNLHDYNLQTGN